MTTVYTIHSAETDKLEAVIVEMQALGAPAIRVVDCGDFYMALEGTHRIAAAHKLGLTPEFIVYGQDDEIEITAFDWYDTASWAETAYPAGEVAGELFSTQAQMYRF